jgi:hypothetical protein
MNTKHLSSTSLRAKKLFERCFGCWPCETTIEYRRIHTKTTRDMKAVDEDFVIVSHGSISLIYQKHWLRGEWFVLVRPCPKCGCDRIERHRIKSWSDLGYAITHLSPSLDHSTISTCLNAGQTINNWREVYGRENNFVKQQVIDLEALLEHMFDR